jgi:hypothetical protein
MKKPVDILSAIQQVFVQKKILQQGCQRYNDTRQHQSYWIGYLRILQVDPGDRPASYATIF